MVNSQESSLSNEHVAGLFDGEGCVYVNRAWRNGRHERYQLLELRVKITNKDTGILVMLTRWLGAGNILQKKGKKEMQYRPCYDWVITGKMNIIKFLSRIKDHVIIKREHVRLALEFCKTIHPSQRGSRPLTLQDREIREKVRCRLTDLYKGIEALPSV